MLVLNPDPYSLPTYRIGTFVTQSISRNFGLSIDFAENAVNYFNNRFGENNWLLTRNGREAIAIAMEKLALSKDSFTTILTPSNNFYISGCVTSTLQNYSNWNREKSSKTVAYLVNHEFGYIYPEMNKLVKEGLPIIEDCCTTFFSQDESQMVGRYGDFSIYSFPKFFSIQIGGLLVGNEIALQMNYTNKVTLNIEEKEHILKVVGYELTQKDEILAKRRELFEYATKSFEKLGFSLRFPNCVGTIPSVLLLHNNGIIKDLNKHKEHLNLHGIQNSVFYGEDAFFIPNHNMLSIQDIDYFVFVTHQYILKQNDYLQY